MTVACPECGAKQTISPLPRHATVLCWRCGTTLERTAGRSAGTALALSAAALVLLLAGNVLPLMRSQLLGAAIAPRAIDGAVAFFDDGWPLMAAFITVFVVVVPILRAAMLSAVLGGLFAGRRDLWQGRLFRYAEALSRWSMAEVYLVAGIVSYSRVAAQLNIEVLPGGWCFASGAGLLMIAEASLDRRRVWTAIRRDEQDRPGVATFGCQACHLVLPVDRAGGRCPRCARWLRVRKPDVFNRTVALTLAAVFLLYPAYFLPMVQSVEPTGINERTMFDGVFELFNRGFWYLGVIIFVVSVAIPWTKLAALIWLATSLKHPHRRGLLLRTKVHRIIDEINHWSFLDPFIVALNSSLLSYPGIASVTPGGGALPFALIVVLTMLASRFFDPRLMWDAAERKAQRSET